jgi:hypothetical protein
MAYLIMVGLSRLNPNPYTRMSLGRPMGSSICRADQSKYPDTVPERWIGFAAYLRPEHPAVTNLDQLIEALVEGKDFHAWFGVRVVSELHVSDQACRKKGR